MATIRIPSDFREFLALLGAERVRYLLIGGYAVGLHGRPRPTGDIDIWVAAELQNATRLARVFDRFGFSGLSPEQFLAPGRISRLGRKPLCLEILNKIAGVEFAACYKRRNTFLVDGVRVHVIDLRDLLKNKRAAGRPKDVADVEAFERAFAKRRSRTKASQRLHGA